MDLLSVLFGAGWMVICMSAAIGAWPEWFHPAAVLVPAQEDNK